MFVFGGVVVVIVDGVVVVVVVVVVDENTSAISRPKRAGAFSIMKATRMGTYLAVS